MYTTPLANNKEHKSITNIPVLISLLQGIRGFKDYLFVTRKLFSGIQPK